MDARTCPACQSPLKADDTFCPRCGGPATSTAGRKRVSKWVWVALGVGLGCPAVLVVLGLVATILVPKVVDSIQEAEIVKAKMDITQILHALNTYAIRNRGQYPESLEVLIAPDETGQRYFQAEAVPRDPWNQEYHYEAPTQDHHAPRVWSNGKDSQPGGDDDIDSRTMNDDR